jgi:hypothetical protein
MNSHSTNPTHSTSPARSIRTRSTGRRLALGGVVGLGLALAVPMAASAHVGVTPDTTAAGSYANLTFGVPHGCDGSATSQFGLTVEGEEEPEHPAPMIVLTEATEDAHGGHGAAESTDEDGTDDGAEDGAAAAASDSADPAVGAAIGLGVGGLVVGLVGVALAIWALRRRSA